MKFQNIIFFGAGAAGSNTLLNVVRDLPEINIFVIDYDKVEERNIVAGTQPYTKSDLNKYKVQALSMIVYSTSKTGKRIGSFNMKINSLEDIKSLNFDWENDLFIDCFDNFESRSIIHGFSKNILHIGFSNSLTGEVCWDEGWHVPSNKSKANEVDICTQQGARSFIITLTGIASSIITQYYFNDIKKNAYYDNTLKLKIF